MNTSLRTIIAAIVSIGMMLSACASTEAPSAKQKVKHATNVAHNGSSGCNAAVAPRAVVSLRPAPIAVSPEDLPSVTEAELLGLLHLTNASDIDAGRVAQDVATDPQVKAFASWMAAAHLSMLQEIDAVAEQLNISPWLSPPARSLAVDLDVAMAILKSRSGSSFDREYLDHEIARHRIMMGSMDAAGQVNDPEFKRVLQDTLPALHAHLTAAQDLRERLNLSVASGKQEARRTPNGAPCDIRRQVRNDGRARNDSTAERKGVARYPTGNADTRP